ncbi:MAG: NTP transferase domain-containing protein [Desulfobacteraceae bacterium]|jgi:CTP:molybdopterin cytidylyltransferase MocA|nr:NTP transferase domain-containing protein [Desulfobacteraceae bacterium]
MTRRRQPSAIILAAGRSRRMRRFKPLLALGGQTVMARVISLYRSAGVTDIRVVTGFRSQTLRSALTGMPVAVVHNPAHDDGMFASVLAGINTLASDVPSFFIHPVDIPLVRPHTLALLMDAFDRRPSPVAYPVFDEKRGHPPLIDGALKAAILSHGGGGGLSALLRRFDTAALDVQVADEGVLLDADTPDDFQRLETRLATPDRLTDDECRVLMKKVHALPGPMIDHCHRVASVAVRLARAVNHRGGALDVHLIQSAAWVHDVARSEKNHAAAGARLLDAMGFPAMATLVASHMDIHLAQDSPVNEAHIVFLADKLVDGTTLVSLKQRFDAKRKKFGHDPQVSEKIDQRQRAALSIQCKVEQLSGQTMDQLLTTVGVIDGRQP